ncbi:MAG: carbamoylphosphate synthase large subunit [Alphaproteobacteria bacterium]|nr:carbamoylphosphate synthase large subunit [Alphaproteobacteria bacterium]
MNFVFISPHFPSHYVNFADRLHNMGVNVFGIADCPYEELAPQLKNSLTEYYRVNSLENYDEVMRAVAFFIHKYGRIDVLESFNEYWLEQDAKLRTDFNIPGTKYPEVLESKRKYLMKSHFKKAGVPAARCHCVTTREEGAKFVAEVGYPVFVKPDIGVGAYASYKINNEEEFNAFYDNYPSVPYVMEEFVNGLIVTFDGVTNAENEPIFMTSHIFPQNVAETVNQGDELFYYSVKKIDPKLEKAGRAVVAAFNTTARFYHFEFFKLYEDKKGLGKKGDYVALEVNMRPPGGCMPELMNYEHDTDVYQLYADMIVHNKLYQPTEKKYVGIYVSRKNCFNYAHSHEEICEKYGYNLMTDVDVDAIFSAVMGDHMYLMRADTAEQAEEIRNFVLEKC